MPAYRFYIEGGTDHHEPDTWVLADLAAAKCEAARTIGAIICDAGHEMWDSRDWGITVTDEAGLILFTLMIVACEAPAIRPAWRGEPAAGARENVPV